MKLSIVAESTKKTIAYKPGIDLQDAYCYAERKIEDKSSDISELVLILWNKILNSTCQPLVEPVTAKGTLRNSTKSI